MICYKSILFEPLHVRMNIFVTAVPDQCSRNSLIFLAIATMRRQSILCLAPSTTPASKHHHSKCIFKLFVPYLVQVQIQDMKDKELWARAFS